MSCITISRAFRWVPLSHHSNPLSTGNQLSIQPYDPTFILG